MQYEVAVVFDQQEVTELASHNSITDSVRSVKKEWVEALDVVCY